ncbi:MAG: Rieske (2Fe-2S) protein [Candidatus Thermoplasmatota archaeon]|jgi:nitrite reductase/ring-hydroxylating ferredoxin subunit|nr:Rieske (2Fe-2S) protein [Candidatus Thermoplasmatota archaeon]
MAWFKVSKEGSMKDGDLSKVNIEGKDILIMKDKGKYYATSCYCTHENYDLSEGFLDDGNLICPNHFAMFKPQDGSVVQNPEGSGDIPSLKTYHTKIENGDLMVEV